MDLISIIVPVYKVEQYLDKCIESIVNQTYTNLEIILVDDGSPDRCGEICESWCVQDSRIKVIHQENMGGGSARNAALDKVQGRFVAFVDSDDYIAPYMFEHLHGLMGNNVGIAECSYVHVDDDSECFERNDYNISTFSQRDALRAHIEEQFFKQVIWNKLYRREVISDIRFPVGTKIDDEYFTYKVLGNAIKLVHSDLVCYAYRQQQHSIMHTVSAEKRLQAIDAKLQRYDYVAANFYELKDICLKNLWFSCIYQGQASLLELKKNEAKKIIKSFYNTLKTYPVNMKVATTKEKLWLVFAKKSLLLTCRIRNILHIGL